MDAEWDCSEVRKEEVEQESCADRREEVAEMNRSADPVEEEEAEGWPCCTPWRRRGGFWVVAASFGACLVGLVCGGFGVGAPRPPPREKMKSIASLAAYPPCSGGTYTTAGVLMGGTPPHPQG